MSVINPESDVWQHIKVLLPRFRIAEARSYRVPVQIPLEYTASNWPIRYSAISADGRFIAVAGRRGLVHYSTTSGRWKLFEDNVQEQAFIVRGGLVWFHHVLIAAVELGRSWQVSSVTITLTLSAQRRKHCGVVVINGFLTYRSHRYDCIHEIWN